MLNTEKIKKEFHQQDNKRQSVTLTKQALNLLFATAKSCIATTDARPQLRYIKIEVTEDTITAVTLDGYRLAKFSIPHNCADVLPFNCFIKPLEVPRQLMEADISPTPHGAEVILRCDCFNMVYAFFAPSADFPEYSQIIPKTDSGTEVYLDAKKLAEVLAPFGKTNDRNSLVRLSFTKQADGSINKLTPVLLSTEQDGTKIESIILPVRYAGRDGE